MMELNATPKTAKPRPAVVFDRGENVRINEGPFRHNNFVHVLEQNSKAACEGDQMRIG